ncbi:MAG: hypothetical protein ACLFP1_07505 [Candidatus Goldiibacteriota bacterium]
MRTRTLKSVSAAVMFVFIAFIILFAVIRSQRAEDVHTNGHEHSKNVSAENLV